MSSYFNATKGQVSQVKIQILLEPYYTLFTLYPFRYLYVLIIVYNQHINISESNSKSIQERHFVPSRDSQIEPQGAQEQQKKVHLVGWEVGWWHGGDCFILFCCCASERQTGASDLIYGFWPVCV